MATKTVAGVTISDWRKLAVEKGMVESRFPCFECNTISSGTTKLVCVGIIKPTEHSITYTVKLEYQVWQTPRVYVIKPDIVPTAQIHIYKEGNLCLFYPKEMPWTHSLHISNTIIPWTAEWLVYYELFKITGKWLGKSVLHEVEAKFE